MNLAAGEATGDYFLFLHADSRIDDPYLLSNALHALQSDPGGQERIAGHYCLRFIRTTNLNTVAYRYAEEKTAFNRVNTTNGDQGLLLTKGFFRHLGGFDESLPFLEDQRISARRFETEGFHRRYILMSMMMGLYSIGAESFFVRAPGVYQVQQETGKLLLSPFFGLIRRLMCDDWGLAGSIRIFYLLGRYIRGNSWQMFYFIDIRLRAMLGAGRYPFLTFHDRIFAPCINFRIFDALTGMLCFIWFMGVLAPFFWLLDYGELNSDSPREVA